MDNYFENKEYKSIDFSVTKIHKGEYDHCRFINCNFENSHISKFEFVEEITTTARGDKGFGSSDMKTKLKSGSDQV